MQAPLAADQSEIDAYRAFAATYAATGCKSCSNGGTVTSYGLTTSAWIAGDVEAAVLNSFVNGATCKIGAIVIFDKVLSDAELQSVTSDPWAMVSGAAVFGVASVSDSTPQPGDSVVITLENGTAPYSNLRIAGQAATIASQDSTTVTITWPDLRTFGNKSLNFNVIYEVLVDDTDGDTANTNITTLPPTGVEIVEVLNPNVTTDSFVYDDSSTMATGDYYSGEWTTGGNSQTFPVDGNTDQLDLPVGTHIAEIYLYQDYGSGFREWVGPATIKLTGRSPGATLSQATINTAGTQVSLLFTEAVTFGAGGNGGLSLSLTRGVDIDAYVSGDGTSTLIYSLDGTVLSDETGTIAYVQPGDGIEANVGNEDVASFSDVAILNDSTQTPAPPVVTVQPEDQSVIEGGQVTFTSTFVNAVTYQWYKDGLLISGETSTSLTVSGLVVDDQTTYYIIGTASDGSTVQSNTVTLTILDAQPLVTGINSLIA